MLVVDFETYYAKDFTLTDMPTAAYINDERFEVIGVCVNGQWFSGTHEETKEFLQQFDWENETCVAHNAMFDGAILEWRFGIKPKRYFCTMMAARPWVVPFTGKSNLAVCVQHYKLGKKGDEVLNAKGLRREDFTPAKLAKYGQYCFNDVQITERLAEKLYHQFPDSELDIIDLTIKKFTRPKLMLDVGVLVRRLDEIKDEKAKALLAIGHENPSILMSNPQFAAALRRKGVRPPTKVSPTTGKETYAFSKDDAEFMELRRHPKVGALIEARLLWKSTIEESRIQHFITVAKAHNNKLAAPLLYAGAHTLRFSGLDKLNLQNLTRGSALREAIVAPPGYAIIAADLAQIEARILATLAGQQDLVYAFASGGDVYSLFATKLYGRPITKFSDPDERFVGKQAILSLGYQAGSQKFYDSMLNHGVDMPFSEAEKVVSTYRQTYPAIPQLWQSMQMLVASMGIGQKHRLGPILADKEVLHLPNNMRIHYPHLHKHGREGSWQYISRSKTGAKVFKHLYGGKLTENVVQALARIVMTTAELRLAKHGLHAALSVHDELVFVVPEAVADKAAKAIKLAMEAPVEWMPDLPVECEVNIGTNYKECK